jgi:hypothetical protein
VNDTACHGSGCWALLFNDGFEQLSMGLAHHLRRPEFDRLDPGSAGQRVPSLGIV